MKRFLPFIIFFALVTSAYSQVTIELWTAKWCSYCPASKKVAKELEDKGYKVTYKDFDSNKTEAEEKGISVLPTAIVRLKEVDYLKLVGDEITVQRIVDIPVPGPDVPSPDEPKEPDFYLTNEQVKGVILEKPRIFRKLQSRSFRGW
jgi:thiol-disulfide isomerase/thioredoxin